MGSKMFFYNVIKFTTTFPLCSAERPLVEK